jgi:hypothetical protein
LRMKAQKKVAFIASCFGDSSPAASCAA